MITTGFSTDTLKVSSSDGHNFILLESFTYTTLKGDIITIPIGTDSDGASTPREIWTEIPPFGTYWKAAYLHDYLYRHTTKPKEECDSILREAMIRLGVPKLEVDIIYEGVALGGESSFKSDRGLL